MTRQEEIETEEKMQAIREKSQRYFDMYMKSVGLNVGPEGIDPDLWNDYFEAVIRSTFDMGFAYGMIHAKRPPEH